MECGMCRWLMWNVLFPSSFPSVEAVQPSRGRPDTAHPRRKGGHLRVRRARPGPWAHHHDHICAEQREQGVVAKKMSPPHVSVAGSPPPVLDTQFVFQHHPMRPKVKRLLERQAWDRDVTVRPPSGLHPRAPIPTCRILKVWGVHDPACVRERSRSPSATCIACAAHAPGRDVGGGLTCRAGWPTHSDIAKRNLRSQISKTCPEFAFSHTILNYN